MPKLTSLKKVLGLAAAALATSGMQIIALFILGAADFGRFVLLYLPLTIGNAAVLAMVCEPWARDRKMTNAGPTDFLTLTLFISLLTGAFTILVGALLGSILPGLLVAVAVAAHVYRVGSRYYAVVEGQRRFITLPDAATVTALIVMLTAWLSTSEPNLVGTCAVWAAASIAGLIFAQWPRRLSSRSEIARWFQSRWATMKPLVWDSALTEAGTVTSPVIQAPIMGFSDFGVFRSVASATAPVRMVLNPMRPNLARIPLGTLTSSRSVGAFTAGVVGTGVLAFAGLRGIGEFGLFAGSAISDLSGLALPVAIFISLFAATIVLYFVMRIHASGRAIVWYRIIQLAMLLLLPTGAYLLWGLAAAVWARGLSSLISLLMATWVLRRPLGS